MTLERAVQRVAEPGKALLVCFAVVSTAVLQFVRHAPPSPDILELPARVIGLSLFAAILVPTAILFIIDRVIARLDGTGRWPQTFRVVMFASAALLVIRQMQLYFGPVRGAWEPVAEGPDFLLVIVAVALFAACFWAARKYYERVCEFCMYLAPVAALVMMITMVQMLPSREAPSSYAQEVTSADGQSGPPVFVFVFDEMATDAIAPDGEIDPVRYPNLAALAADGTYFPDATTNYMHTTYVIPSMIESLIPLTDEYDLRVYDQDAWTESLTYGGCGEAFTCRGATYVADQNTASLTSDTLLRTVYEATPSVLEDLARAPMGWLSDRMDTALPSVDPRHVFGLGDEQFATLLGDVDAEESQGRIHFYHTMIPHAPFIYDREGNATTDPTYTTYRLHEDGSLGVYDRYLQQIEYADTVLGEFIAHLKAEGIYDESVLIVTADHGLRTFSPIVTEPVEITSLVTDVPLIIHGSSTASGTVSAVDYQHMDLGATVADLISADYPADADGVSAFSAERPDRDKVLYVDDDNKRYWTYVREADAEEWALNSETVGPLRDFGVDIVAHAGD